MHLKSKYLRYCAHHHQIQKPEPQWKCKEPGYIEDYCKCLLHFTWTNKQGSEIASAFKDFFFLENGTVTIFYDNLNFVILPMVSEVWLPTTRRSIGWLLSDLCKEVEGDDSVVPFTLASACGWKLRERRRNCYWQFDTVAQVSVSLCFLFIP